MTKLPAETILEVVQIGHNKNGEVILNIPGIGRLVMPVCQAHNLSKALRSQALLAKKEFLNNQPNVKT